MGSLNRLYFPLWKYYILQGGGATNCLGGRDGIVVKNRGKEAIESVTRLIVNNPDGKSTTSNIFRLTAVEMKTGNFMVFISVSVRNIICDRIFKGEKGLNLGLSRDL